jgi:hypothetical protein
MSTAPKKEKQKQIRNRSIRTDSLLRETSSHYIRQVGDADRKARILLVVTSVMMTLGLAILTKNVTNIPFAWISATILIVFNLFTLVFAILSIRPILRGDAAKQTENNMLHYKTCTEYMLPLYTEKMVETLDDDHKKRDAIIKELYYYGNLLEEKYKCIEKAYRAFLLGIVISIGSYILIFVFNQF